MELLIKELSTLLKELYCPHCQRIRKDFKSDILSISTVIAKILKVFGNIVDRIHESSTQLRIIREKAQDPQLQFEFDIGRLDTAIRTMGNLVNFLNSGKGQITNADQATKNFISTIRKKPRRF
jgi:phage-related protein